MSLCVRLSSPSVQARMTTFRITTETESELRYIEQYQIGTFGKAQSMKNIISESVKTLADRIRMEQTGINGKSDKR
jgi:hypothetical protein